MVRSSRWFRVYSLLLATCALACVLALQYAHRRPDVVRFARYRAEADRIIEQALPPGWTAARGFYTARFDDPRGTPRALVRFASDSRGRPLLIATIPQTPEGPPTSWDPDDPTSLAGLRAWLIGIPDSTAHRPGARSVRCPGGAAAGREG